MISKLHKNTILTSYVDAFCLACQQHIRTTDDAYGHITTSDHTKSLARTLYVEKYKNDYIRKIKKLYFCECCNLILSTMINVGLHVAEAKHIENRNLIVFTRKGDSIVAFGKIAINEKTWNGLIDVACHLCEEEFDDEYQVHEHMTEPSHIINLVQSKIEIGADNSIYRKINANTFQCLTCNDVLSMNILDRHFQEDSHKQLFNVCCQSNLLTSNNIDLVENKAQESKPSPNTKLNNVQVPVEEPTKKDAKLFKSIAQESKPSTDTTLDNVQVPVEEPTKKDATLFNSTAQERKPSPNTTLDNVQVPVEEPTKKDAMLFNSTAQESKPSTDTILDNVQVPVEEPTKKDAMLFNSTAQESKPSTDTTLDNVQVPVEEPTKKDAMLFNSTAQESKPSADTILDNVQVPVEQPTKKDATLKSTAQESKPSPNTTLDTVQVPVEKPIKKDATLKSTAQESKPSPNTTLDTVQVPVEKPIKKDATLKSTAQESKPSPNTTLDNVQVPVEKPIKKDATLKSTAQESKPSPNTTLDNVQLPVEKPTKKDALKSTAQESKPSPNTKLDNVQVSVKEPTKKDAPLFKSGFLLDNSASKTDQKGRPPKKPQSAPIAHEKVTSEIDDAICTAFNAKDYIIDDDNGLRWCLLCDWVLAPASMRMHLPTKHHQTILKMHRESIKKRQEAKNAVNNNSPVDSEVSEKKNGPKIEKSEKVEENVAEIGEIDTDREKILESLNLYEKNHITIDFLAAKPWAQCTKCKKSVDFNSKALDAHIECHRKEVRPPSRKASLPNEAEVKSPQPAPIQTKKKQIEIEIPRAKEAEEMSKFAKDNNIHKQKKKWTCKSCNVPLTSSLKAFKDHVDSKEHKEIVTVKIVKFKSTDYLTSIAVTEDNIYRDFVVNDKFVINEMSFMTISKAGSSLRCEACQLDMTDLQLLKHKIALQHEQALKNTFVITSLEPDFIRELRPGVYHCAFCNVCLLNFEELESHIRSPLHLEARTSSEWRLQKYLPGILADRKKQPANIDSNKYRDVMRLLGGDVFK